MIEMKHKHHLPDELNLENVKTRKSIRQRKRTNPKSKPNKFKKSGTI